MDGNYQKKEIFEFCEIKNVMVRLEVIQATVRMPDYVHAELKLIPVNCNRKDTCERERISCIVYDRDGRDPCPDAWRAD